jgi:hypothetical protein
MNVIPGWDQLPDTLTWKEKVSYLAAFMSAGPHSDKCPVEHQLGHGLYIRTITIPAQQIFIGREHAEGHLMTLLKGSVILIRPERKIRYDAVKSLITSVGFQAVAYTLTDVVVQTVHGNPDGLEDTQVIEDRVFRPAEKTLEAGRLLMQRFLA